MDRNKCVFCGAHDSFELIECINNVPLFMGAVEENDNTHWQGQLIYVKCKKCLGIQIENLIEENFLYKKSNHNTEIIGKTWIEHNNDFCSFINENSQFKNVLEVGDPVGKLASLMNYENWFIVEPNPSENVKNVQFIKSFLKNAKIPEDVDVLIMSHTFEHLLNPMQDLKKLHKSTKKDVKLFLSIPQFEWFVETENLPIAGMHFEHTFFADPSHLDEMLLKSGFSVIKWQKFKNHSWFVFAEKINKQNIKYNHYDYSFKIKGIIEKYKDKVSVYNDLIKNQYINKKILLYGAHYPAQLLISFGLDESRIYDVIDNAKSKQNKFLYSTKLKTYDPSIIKDENFVVICEMGVYNEEIKNQLLSINSETIIL